MVLHRMGSRVGSFGGLKIVPPILVPAVRSILASQGITDPTAISDDGTLDATALLVMGFDRAEMRSTLTGSYVIDLKAPTDPATDARMKAIKPTIILTGRAGTATIAPWGVATTISPQVKQIGIAVAAGLAASVLGLVVFGGLLGRRSKR